MNAIKFVVGGAIALAIAYLIGTLAVRSVMPIRLYAVFAAPLVEEMLKRTMSRFTGDKYGIIGLVFGLLEWAVCYSDVYFVYRIIVVVLHFFCNFVSSTDVEEEGNMGTVSAILLHGTWNAVVTVGSFLG